MLREVLTPDEHPLIHDVLSTPISLTGGVFPELNTLQKFMDYTIGVLYPNIQPAVADVASLPAAGNTLGDFRVVMDDGDGKMAGYKWWQNEGDVAPEWKKVYDVDWGLGTILAYMTEQTQELFVVKTGSRARDASGAYIAGLYAGQHIYGGTQVDENLTLFANSGDVLPAHTGYVQVDDNFRPTANEAYNSGTATERWLKVFTKSLEVGFLTIADGALKTLVTSTQPEIDFAALNLTTTGAVAAGTAAITTQATVAGFTLADIAGPIGRLTHSSGEISFDNENLTTTGTLTVSGTTILSGFEFSTQAGPIGRITHTSGEISFDNENLITTGTLQAGVATFTQLNVDNLQLDGNTISSLNVNGAIILAPNGTGVVDVQKTMTTLDITATGTLTVTGQANVDNLRLDGNTLSSTNENGSIFLSPDGLGLVEFSKTLRPTTNGTLDIGDATHRVQKLFASSAISDGTNEITLATLLSLRDINVGPVQDGWSIFWSAVESKWVCSYPDTEIKHELVAGLHSGAVIPSTAADAGHPQFVLLAGRAGGQTVLGGTAASENLTLGSTAHVTKGYILFQDTLAPATNASYGGGVWSGTDIGDGTHYIKDVYSKGEYKGLRLENYTEGTKPGFSGQNIGRLIYCTDSFKVYVDTGAALKEVGVSVAPVLPLWSNADGGPVEVYEDHQPVFQFEATLGQTLYAVVKVPSNYEAGNQIFLDAIFYSPGDEDDKFKMESKTTLVRVGTHAIDVAGNTNDSSTELTNPATAKVVRKITFNLTDADGEIDSVAVAAGDLLRVALSRIAASGDEDAQATRMIKSGEVRFA